MITVSSQSGDTTGTKWEAVTVSRFEQRQRSEFRDRRVRGSIGQSDEQFEHGLGRITIWMDVTDPHVIGLLPQTVLSAASDDDQLRSALDGEFYSERA